jgi:arginyl-tRNA synthetase
LIRDYVREQVAQVLSGWDGVPPQFEIELETPNNPEHGDLSTNTALRLAKHLRKAPRAIADELCEGLRPRLDPGLVAAVELAGAGFVNFRFAPTYLYRELAALLEEGRSFGRSPRLGKSAIVEFVSANPTGPLTVGHGRNAVLGDTIANLLDWGGYDVTREYYFNDAGRQMRVLGESVRARYEEILNPDLPRKEIKGPGGSRVSVPASFPDDGYLGDYIVDIARSVHDKMGAVANPLPELDVFKEAAEELIFAQIEATLRRLGIHMDTHFNEHSLYESNAVWEVLDHLRETGYVYEQDGAVWLRLSELGREKDRVLVKSSGEPTYRLPDIAYHVDKLLRDFDLAVDIFGADHIDTYPDILSALRVLGYDDRRVNVVIYQFVTLVRGGEPVKMSTRMATYETLNDLLDEVGEDVTRFFFLMRSPHAHLEFDLDLAKEASEKNPVFYLQYAHARIRAILRKAEEVGFEFADDARLELLDDPVQQDLIKSLLRLPDVIAAAAAEFEPHRLTGYLRDVAVAFTQFYGNSRIIGEAEDVATARMALARATQLVLANGLGILGIEAPQRM